LSFKLNIEQVKLRLLAYLFLIGLVPSFYVDAQSTVVFTESSSSISLEDKALVYFDKNASASTEQILDAYYSKQFNKKN